MKILRIDISSNPICPKCGSSNVGFGVSHRGAGSQAECRDCGYCWE
jgi:predicted RNA-binding Zn-ribbon protein involved in translation (DUF1610 family)